MSQAFNGGQSIRRHRHRRRAGRAPARRAADRRRHEGGAGRAGAVRRNVRQHRLHADEDAGRQRLCRPPGPPRRRLRRGDRGAVSVDMAKRQGAQGRHHAGRSRDGVEAWLRQHAGCTVIRGQPASRIRDTVRVGDEVLTRRANLHQRRRTRLGARHARAGRGPLPQQRSILALDRCPSIWSSSAAAISGWSSRRCTGASAPGHGRREGSAADRAGGRGCLGRDQEILEAEGIAVRRRRR